MTLVSESTDPDVMRGVLFRGLPMRPLVLMLWLGLMAGCSDGSTAPPDAPANHTVNKSGVWHSPGLTAPEGVCTTCHGADLRGGTEGQPSCYSCHGKKWN